MTFIAQYFLSGLCHIFKRTALDHLMTEKTTDRLLLLSRIACLRTDRGDTIRKQIMSSFGGVSKEMSIEHT